MITAKIVNTHEILKFNQCIDKLRKQLPGERAEFQLTYEHMLEESASQVHIELLRIGRVSDVRLAASSYRSLCAVWKSYPALYHHCMYSDSSKQSKHKSTSTGMANVLKSPQFVHSLAVLLDALESISKLSLALQSETCSLGEAYSKVKRAIR